MRLGSSKSLLVCRFLERCVGCRISWENAGVALDASLESRSVAKTAGIVVFPQPAITKGRENVPSKLSVLRLFCVASCRFSPRKQRGVDWVDRTGAEGGAGKYSYFILYNKPGELQQCRSTCSMVTYPSRLLSRPFSFQERPVPGLLQLLMAYRDNGKLASNRVVLRNEEMRTQEEQLKRRDLPYGLGFL